MWQHYLKTAWRNISRSKAFSLINIIGFAVSMSLGLLVMLIIKDQYAFDRFHQDAESIYRVNTMALRTNGDQESYASTPLPLGHSILTDYSFAQELVRINASLNTDATFNNTTVRIRGCFTDPAYFTVFNFPFDSGDKTTALNTPNGLVLTKPTATRLFGNDNAIGKTVDLGRFGSFIVTGVLKDPPGKTHLEFEAMAPMGAFEALEKTNAVQPSMNDWTNYYTGYLYIKLKHGIKESTVTEALSALSLTKYKDLALETRDKGYQFFLQPLLGISPGPMHSNQLGKALPETISHFLIILALVILLMAGLNYTSLTIAKSLKRAREIGVRKVVGAKRSQVFVQFLGESVLFALVALICSYLLLQWLKAMFMQLQVASEFAIDLSESPWIYWWFAAFAILAGLIAGIFPAIYLSRFKPIDVLKNILSAKSGSKVNMRKALTVFQFTVSLIFIVAVLVIYSQISFMMKANYGIHEKNLVNLQLQENNYNMLSNKLNQVPGVLSIGGVSHSLGTSADGSGDYRRNLSQDAMVIRDFSVNNEYLKNLGIQFMAGQAFSVRADSAIESEAIINETALKVFGFNNASEALNQPIYAADSTALRITGVVKDFNFRPLTYDIGPLVLRHRPAAFNIINIAIEPMARTRVLTAIEKIWKETDPNHLIGMTMMEDELDAVYDQSGFTDMLKVIGYITFLAIVIACFGLLGMVMFSMEHKVKEIGLRKVMGGSIWQITWSLTKSFAFLIIIGLAIGLPVGYWIGHEMLGTFAYRISNLGLLVAVGTLLLAAMGIITIGTQTLRAARANPIKSLRTE